MRVRKLDRPRGWGFVVGAAILKPLLFATTRHQWIDGTKIPATGGCVLVVNHMTHVDPLTTAHFVYDHGRLPRYLAKAGLFKSKVLGTFLRGAGQIPVERLTTEAVGAYAAAVAAVEAGECVVVYPEGTITRDPDLWPMTGKTGAARIALATGCPVIPVAHWGAQELLAPYAKRPDLFPRKKVVYQVGDPVPLDDLRAEPISPEVIHQATDRIMDAITALLAGLRDETPPAERFDPRKRGVKEIGNPHSDDEKGGGRR
ncbi:lysophospholipid acyltransferase family protein [Nocardioides dubius]|uniref:lysophospholipid acyltransferase family protein n=1 Tax=Nocardioides dubius TaxID=317019 RepID=UPI0039EA0B9A